MSQMTVSSLKRIAAAKLADMLLASSAAGGESKLAVVDVRDDDHIGGHIRTSMHFPTQSLDATMPTLMRKLADKDIVVFHCAQSQQRGPSAALRYLREKEARGESLDKQKVYILDGGFIGWQEIYGPDERVTEGYREEIWKDGYWM
ncbi:Rhodanese-like protein [Xylaria sp. FL1042]|nr:Rhodanese-like protein [Xylaria sp. FL1042]